MSGAPGSRRPKPLSARTCAAAGAVAVALFVFPISAVAADASAPAVASGRVVPPEVAAALAAAAGAANPTAALAALDAYQGPPQALIELARAQADDAFADQARSAATAAATVDPHRQAATAAYHQALALDPNLRQAHLGLAQQAARVNDWATALAEVAPGLDLDRATAPELLFYAQAAIATGDWTLAGVISERGILRFPAEKSFRQLRLDALVRAGEILPARAAALALLDAGPDDAALWRTVAWCDRQSGDAAGERAALEAVWLAPGHDGADAMRLAHAQLDAGEPRAALATLGALLPDAAAAGAAASGTAASTAVAAARVDTSAEAATVALAVSAARACGDLTAANAWLARIAPSARDRRLRLLAAEIAVQSGDNAAAASAAADLIALGEGDPAVLVWAGALAERGNDFAHGEAWYRQAFASNPTSNPTSNPSAKTASDAATASEAPGVVTAGIRLAALLLRQGRRDEARDVLAVVLARHPDDEAAHRLMDLASQAR